MTTVLLANGTLVGPLDAGLAATTALLGPFGSIDMWYQRPPASLQELIREATRTLGSALQSSIECQAKFTSIMTSGTESIVPVPWLNVTVSTIGGSLLCPSVAASALALSMISLATHDSCSTTAYASTVNKDAMVLALAALFSPGVDASLICSMVLANRASCLDYVGKSMMFATTHLAVDTEMLTTAATDMVAANVSFVQYVTDGSHPAWVAAVPALDVAAVPFFNWIYAYDWVLGHREVIRFVGDKSTVTILTTFNHYTSQATDANMLPTTMASYARACVMYI
ncbi:hypothetical protein ACHHYP_06790, partial [Achlya hypogyna]